MEVIPEAGIVGGASLLRTARASSVIFGDATQGVKSTPSQLRHPNAPLNGVATRLGISEEALERIARRAGANGTGFQDEMIASGIVDGDALYKAIAEELGLPFVTSVDPTRLIVRDRDLPAILTRAGGATLALS